MKTLILAVAIAAFGSTAALAQDAMNADDKMASHDAMAPGGKRASHDAMTTDHMASGKKMTKAPIKQHDAIMKHDAMKADAMKSSTPQ